MQDITHCTNCESTNFKHLFSGRDRLHSQDGEFSLIECRDCGLVHLTPQPGIKEIQQYYPEDYISFPKAIEDETSWFRRLDRRYGLHRRCREVIFRAGSPGRLLDVGCATGIFLNGMRQRGWEVNGVEPSHFAAEYGRKRFKLNIFEGYLNETNFQEEFFNVVTLWDVLEHVPDPHNLLSEIARILKPGGLLVISLPNPCSWETRIFKEYWAGWDIPRHFHIFPVATLGQLVNKTGLDLNEVTSFTGRHGVLVLNTQFWLGDLQISNRIKRMITAIVKSLPVRLLTYPIYTISECMNKSSIMVVFIQKPFQ